MSKKLIERLINHPMTYEYVPHKKEDNIYFLLKDDILVYIGKTQDLHSRLEYHEIEYDRAFFLSGVSVRDVPELERALILAMEPQHNIQKLSTTRAEEVIAEYMLKDIASYESSV